MKTASAKAKYWGKYTKAKTLEDFLTQRYRVAENSCWEALVSTDRHGYPQHHSRPLKKKYNKSRLHQLAYICWIGDIPKDLCVLHKCDNTICINPEHLFLGTHTDNNNDKVTKKRHQFGETHHNHKLTEEQIKYIRTLKDKKSSSEIAEEVGDISPATIRDVLCNRSWRHI